MARAVQLRGEHMHTLLALLWILQSAPPVVEPSQAAANEQLARAEARYRSAIAATSNPTMAAAYQESLALMLERQGRMEDALASHREAVRLDSTSARNRAGLGLLLLKLDKTADAIPQLRVASEVDRNSLELRMALASALRAQSRHEEAIVVLREARVLDSTDTSIDSAIAQSQTGDAADGYHDYSGFADDHVANRAVRHVLQWVFAVVLGICGLALVAPIVSGVMLAIMSATRPLTRRVRA